MISPVVLLVSTVAYVGLLFLLARYAERTRRGRALASNGMVYGLSLGVYCTTWTVFGSVGKAANEGMLWLTIYLGPACGLMIAGPLWRRLVRLKHRHRLTSLADYVSARYGKSRAIAAFITAALVVGIVPYLALQLKAVTASFTMAAGLEAGSAATWYLSPVIIALMIIFTIVFGIRKLDPSERHPGMLFSLAIESIVKLVAVLAVGLYVIIEIFGGFGGFLSRLDTTMATTPFFADATAPQTLTWVVYLLVSMSAFALLPRQFHMGVIENNEEKHIRQASWIQPIYLILINVFVLPIAVAGILTAPAGTPGDGYVLMLPLQSGKTWLALIVFLGGISAAIGMIVVETMAMATMISNHLVVPLLQSTRRLHFLQRRVLYLRWVAAAVMILAAYGFEVAVGKSAMLVSMGMLSFAAAFQFAPTVVLGLAWRRASKGGAMLGLVLGFATWFYCLFLPTFVKSGWVAKSFVAEGPFGIAALRPEALFGLEGLPPYAHGVLWSMALNVIGYVVGSALWPMTADDHRMAEEFLDAGAAKPVAEGPAVIPVGEKVQALRAVLARYYSPAEATRLIDDAVATCGLVGKEHVAVEEWAELHRQAERSLAGAIGAASAHAAMQEQGAAVTRDESKALARYYGRVLANLRLAPSELRQRIDYYQEREALLTQQARELEERVQARTRELEAAQRELVDTARRAGQAENATNVLHNVGNLLNTITVSVGASQEILQGSKIAVIEKLSGLLRQHNGSLAEFLASERGKRLPEVLRLAAEELARERGALLEEMETLAKTLEHVKVIVSMQQSYARGTQMFEKLALRSVVEDAVSVHVVALSQQGIRLVRHYDDLGEMTVEKHKILQILINLISNAKHALLERRASDEAFEPEIRVELRAMKPGGARITVTDNGIGIAPENLDKIFQHGFTTKASGHGFGLHGAALAAREMGGRISVKSDGPRQGASFTLEVAAAVATGRPTHQRIAGGDDVASAM